MRADHRINADSEYNSDLSHHDAAPDSVAQNFTWIKCPLPPTTNCYVWNT